MTYRQYAQIQEMILLRHHPNQLLAKHSEIFLKFFFHMKSIVWFNNID